jgi:Zn finger protein HypA/HybF involved in hydrogenase expression
MHEMSIALEVGRIIEHRIAADRLADIVSVRLEVGDEAGVECDSLQLSLDVLLASPPFAHTKAEILRVPGDVLRVSQVELRDGSPND